MRPQPFGHGTLLVVHGHEGRDQASMRPQPFGRGKVSSIVPLSVLLDGFNEAATFRSRKFAAPLDTRESLTGFNEAATFRSRKSRK
jgi:hypothetical protein